MNCQIPLDELRRELQKFGYADISEELLEKFKTDLDHLMTEDYLMENRRKSPPSEISESTTFDSSNTSNYLNDFITVPTNTKPKEKLFNAQHTIALASNISSNSSRILKRKTLRRNNNGKLYIEETSLTSVILESTSSVMENDIMMKKPQFYNKKKSRSTGNLFETCKTTSVKLPTVLPMVAYGSKQCDPVNRYHQYRKYWDCHKTPSEKSRKTLRWNVREQMLDYDPIAEFSLKQMPNIFKIPKERRSNIYRWNSCSNLNDKFC